MVLIGCFTNQLRINLNSYAEQICLSTVTIWAKVDCKYEVHMRYERLFNYFWLLWRLSVFVTKSVCRARHKLDVNVSVFLRDQRIINSCLVFLWSLKNKLQRQCKHFQNNCQPRWSQRMFFKCKWMSFLFKFVARVLS